MDFTLALLGLSLYILIWEKLPDWGNWFNAFLKRLPGPLQTLYEQWRCPYCVGFWMALVLHAATGVWTLPVLADLPSYWGPIAPFVGWSLDALATAALIYIAKMTIDAIGLPAMKGFMMKDEFMKGLKADTKDG